MLISWAILSRTAAVGVGFLLNSISRVTSCSCVARWRFWFFCCCVRVLFRGRRFVDCGAVAVLDVDGEGVDVEDAVAADVAVADVVEGVSVEDMAGDMSGRARSGVVYTGPGFVRSGQQRKRKVVNSCLSKPRQARERSDRTNGRAATVRPRGRYLVCADQAGVC